MHGRREEYVAQTLGSNTAAMLWTGMEIHPVLPNADDLLPPIP